MEVVGLAEKVEVAEVAEACRDLVASPVTESKLSGSGYLETRVRSPVNVGSRCACYASSILLTAARCYGSPWDFRPVVRDSW